MLVSYLTAHIVLHYSKFGVIVFYMTFLWCRTYLSQIGTHTPLELALTILVHYVDYLNFA